MYLLDTNVVSEFRRLRGGRADQNIARWFQSVRPSQTYISAITLHELEVGVLLAERRDPPQGAVLRRWMTEGVLVAYSGRVLAMDERVALLSPGFQVPDPHPLRDGFIAATALVHNLTVVTRNVGDFARTGVRLLNPWEPR